MQGARSRSWSKSLTGRSRILGPGRGSLDTGAWDQTFTGTVSGTGLLSKEGTGTLTLDNPSATWTGGTRIRGGTLELGRRGSNGLLPGTLDNPSSVVVHSGATLRFNRGSDKSFFDIISGPGGVTVANSPNATVRLVSDNTYTGPTTISSGTLMIGQGNPSQPGAAQKGSDPANRARAAAYRTRSRSSIEALSSIRRVVRAASWSGK